jgi:hypothetical protein
VNESTVIPLNGVSRVRIPPPPPVSTPAAPACQPGASRLSAHFGLQRPSLSAVSFSRSGPAVQRTGNHFLRRLGSTLLARLRDDLLKC